MIRAGQKLRNFKSNGKISFFFKSFLGSFPLFSPCCFHSFSSGGKILREVGEEGRRGEKKGGRRGNPTTTKLYTVFSFEKWKTSHKNLHFGWKAGLLKDVRMNFFWLVLFLMCHVFHEGLGEELLQRARAANVFRECYLQVLISLSISASLLGSFPTSVCKADSSRLGERLWNPDFIYTLCGINPRGSWNQRTDTVPCDFIWPTATNQVLLNMEEHEQSIV